LSTPPLQDWDLKHTICTQKITDDTGSLAL
jgi:hypothetical protein